MPAAVREVPLVESLPEYVTQIALAVKKGSRKGFPSTGQVAVLNAVAVVQTQLAVDGYQSYRRGPTLAELVAHTGFSGTTVRRGLNHFVACGVLRKVETGLTYWEVVL